MNYRVQTISVFERQAKRLKKKYPSLKGELLTLLNTLKSDPKQGKEIGRSCFKVRIAIKSKGRGKSGGGRVITNFVFSQSTVYLLTIYDKSEQSDISDTELNDLLKHIPD